MSDPVLDSHINTRNAAWKEAYGPAAYAHYVETVLPPRAETYAAHVASMSLMPHVVQWAISMAAQYGPYVRIHSFIADWVTALLIVRYGEEPDGTKTVDGVEWPSAFTDADMGRAMQLLNGHNWPVELNRLPKIEG